MMINTNAHNVRILLLLLQPLCVSPSLICPDISYLGVPVQLICTGGTVAHTYYNTRGAEVAKCGLTIGSCEPTNSTAYVISANQTALNIASVQISDAGNWSCKNGLNSNQPCNLIIANIPTYNITSDRATDAMDVHDGVSLTVDIRGFYCSAAHNLTLQVGSVTLPLNMYLPEAVTEPTNRNFTISINVSESHLRDVELIFLCNDHQLNVSHRSVTQPQQNDSTKVTGSTPTPETPQITSEELENILIALGVCDIAVIAIVISLCYYRHRHNANPVGPLNQLNDPPQRINPVGEHLPTSSVDVTRGALHVEDRDVNSARGSPPAYACSDAFFAATGGRGNLGHVRVPKRKL